MFDGIKLNRRCQRDTLRRVVQVPVSDPSGDSNNAQHASLPGELFRHFKKKASAAAEVMPLSRTWKVQEVRGIRSEAKHHDKELKTQPNLKPDKRHRARKEWLKAETFERAANLLVGQSAHASPSAIRASYRRVEKSISHRNCIQGLWFDDDFLYKLGVIKCLTKDLVQKGLFF